jgi:hypothetical protein
MPRNRLSMLHILLGNSSGVDAQTGCQIACITTGSDFIKVERLGCLQVTKYAWIYDWTWSRGFAVGTNAKVIRMSKIV